MGTGSGVGAFNDAVTGAQEGDEQSFAILWRWIHPALVRWLRAVGTESVEDVASEVWLSVVRGMRTFEGDEGQFRAWIFTIARCRAVDSARRRARQPRVVSLDDVDTVDPTAASTASVDAATALDAAIALLRGLRPEQREVVALRVIAGLTAAETAAIVNKTEGAVRVICHRALRTLARRMDVATSAEQVNA